MPYNPNNNPYIPGDPYSYDLKWMVSKVKETITKAETAKTTADTALSTANTANSTANSALNTANSANTAAGNAVNTANSAAGDAAAAVSTANSALAKATAPFSVHYIFVDDDDSSVSWNIAPADLQPIVDAAVNGTLLMDIQDTELDALRHFHVQPSPYTISHPENGPIRLKFYYFAMKNADPDLGENAALLTARFTLDLTKSGDTWTASFSNRTLFGIEPDYIIPAV